MHHKNLFDNITQTMGLPSEPAPGQSVVELFGTGRVVIENHKGITQYSSNEMLINVNYGLIRIYGQNMHIASMTNCRLIIHGCIDGIETRRRC